MWQRNQLQLADVYRKLGRVTEAEKVENELWKMLIDADLITPLFAPYTSVNTVKNRTHPKPQDNSRTPSQVTARRGCSIFPSMRNTPSSGVQSSANARASDAGKRSFAMLEC